MNDLFFGLPLGLPLGAWLVGLAIAIAWLANGLSAPRLGVLALAILWPAAPAAYAWSQFEDALREAERFRSLCAGEANDRILDRSQPVSAIFVESASDVERGYEFAQYGNEIGPRLTLERPGYREIHVIQPDPKGGAKTYTVLKRGQHYRGPNPDGAVNDEKMARYGVQFEFVSGTVRDVVREFRVVVIDRQTNGILAEQKSFFYRSGDISLGGFPLWRYQTRYCPLMHPADLVRTVLPPRDEGGES